MKFRKDTMKNKNKKDEKNTEESEAKEKRIISIGDLDSISFDQLDKL